jgi:hypothetical protein
MGHRRQDEPGFVPRGAAPVARRSISTGRLLALTSDRVRSVPKRPKCNDFPAAVASTHLVAQIVPDKTNAT